MKRNILSALTAMLILHATAYTQTTKPQAPVKTGNEWKMPSDVFQRAKTYSSALQKKLGLDSIQTKISTTVMPILHLKMIKQIN